MKKKCSKCDKKSLPGLKGIGLCQFHWSEAMWGTEWAKKCQEERKQERTRNK